MKNERCQIEKSLETLRPGEVVLAVAKRFGQNPKTFLAKNFARIGLESVKSGAIKTKDLVVAAAKFSKKNKEDDSGIAWDKLQIDPSTLQFGGLLLGKRAGDRLEELETQLSRELKKSKASQKKEEKEDKEEKEESQQQQQQDDDNEKSTEEEQKKEDRTASARFSKKKEEKIKAKSKEELRRSIAQTMDGKKQKIK